MEMQNVHRGDCHAASPERSFVHSLRLVRATMAFPGLKAWLYPPVDGDCHAAPPEHSIMHSLRLVRATMALPGLKAWLYPHVFLPGGNIHPSRAV